MNVGVTIHDGTARKWLRGFGRWKLRQKSLNICHQSSIYYQNLGGTVRFEFKSPYKLSMLVQQRTLCIIIIFGAF